MWQIVYVEPVYDFFFSLFGRNFAVNAAQPESGCVILIAKHF